MTSDKEPEYSPPSIPGDDQTYSDEDISFNTCLTSAGTRENSGGTDNTGRFYPYALVVHEVGHALGLSGYTIGDVARGKLGMDERPYVMSHPTIPDAAMNYDSRVRLAALGNADDHEPDCSPHPFDLMALHSLYQPE